MSREWGCTALTCGRLENHLFLAEDDVRDRDEYGPRGEHDPHGNAFSRLVAALERSDGEPLAINRGLPRRTGESRGIGSGR